MDRGPRISSGRAVADSRWWKRARSAGLPSAPKPSGCATMLPPASTAITFHRAGRFPSPSSAPRVRSRMSTSTGVSEASHYFVQVFDVVRRSFTGLVRPPSSSRRAEAAARLRRHAVSLLAVGAVVVVGLMVFVDAREIGLMPPRGTASLWPERILTDFGKETYVMEALGLALVIVALILPRSRENL